MSTPSALESIQYTRGSFKILDQLKVPHELIYQSILSVSDGVKAIETMQVRGAPLIAIVGCLSISIELDQQLKSQQRATTIVQTFEELQNYISTQVERLIAARPTAVNMRKEGQQLIEYLELLKNTGEISDVDATKLKLIEYIENLLKVDVETNIAIGKHGAESIIQFNTNSTLDKLNILTHCNTGSLATCGFGTALGVIRTLYGLGKLEHCYFTETRPYNQGSRLTSFELLHDKIPSTLICDSAVSWLMKTKGIHGVVVGADRVVRNGDTANKIGTYQLAIAAKAHNVPFYIAAPFSTIDTNIESGDKIQIEERSETEVTNIAGTRISPIGISVWNPAFDVTPKDLITGIITEEGVFSPDHLKSRLSS